MTVVGILAVLPMEMTVVAGTMTVALLLMAEGATEVVTEVVVSISLYACGLHCICACVCSPALLRL